MAVNLDCLRVSPRTGSDCTFAVIDLNSEFSIFR